MTTNITELKRWEKIKEAMDNPSTAVRAKFMFELMEEERKIGEEIFVKNILEDRIKLAIAKHNKEIGYKAPKNKNKKGNSFNKGKFEEDDDEEN